MQLVNRSYQIHILVLALLFLCSPNAESNEFQQFSTESKSSLHADKSPNNLETVKKENLEYLWNVSLEKEPMLSLRLKLLDSKLLPEFVIDEYFKVLKPGVCIRINDSYCLSAGSGPGMIKKSNLPKLPEISSPSQLELSRRIESFQKECKLSQKERYQLCFTLFSYASNLRDRLALYQAYRDTQVEGRSSDVANRRLELVQLVGEDAVKVIDSRLNSVKLR